MRIETFSYNNNDDLASHTYILVDSKNKAVVVDPSVNYDGIVNYLIDNKIKLVGVLLTHAHYDHIGGVDKLIKKFNVPLYCHELEIESLTDPHKNCSEQLNVTVKSKAIPISDNDKLSLLKDDKIEVIHTPFHTEGSVCYYLPKSKMLISGDTLFKMTIGRTDLPTSAPRFKRESLDKLLKLPKEIAIYPGHGRNTTLESELAFNRFLMR